MSVTGRTHGHFDMAQGGIIGPDDMTVTLSGNMLLQPEQKGLTGSDALMETSDDPLQGGDSGDWVRSRRSVKSVSPGEVVRNDEKNAAHRKERDETCRNGYVVPAGQAKLKAESEGEWGSREKDET
jgi:hypothetical protein